MKKFPPNGLQGLSFFSILFLSAMLLVTGMTATPTLGAVATEDRVSYQNDILPLFNRVCKDCHGPEEAEAFRIDVESEMLEYVEKGDAEGSDLYYYMTLSLDDDMVMPPADYEKGRPTQGEISKVKLWIEQGASTQDVPADGAGDQGDAAAMAANEGADDGDVGDADAAPAKAPSKFEEHIYNAIGSLHTAGVHLPIGVLLVAGLFAFLSLRGSFVMSDCAYYCLWLGTLGAIFACVSGWWYSPMEHRGTVTELNDLLDQGHKVFWHRSAGLVITAAAVLVCLIAKGARNRDPDDGMLWKFGAILLAAGIGWVGHLGGELTYGKDHYKDLNAVVDMLMQPGGPKADVDGDKPVDESLMPQSDATQSDATQSDAPKSDATTDQKPDVEGDSPRSDI